MEMEEIYEFLSIQGVTDTEINELRLNEITIKQLKDMNEADLKVFIRKYAHRVALRDYLNLKLGNRRKEKLVKELKLKMKKHGLEYNLRDKSKKKRIDRQILLGWIMCWDGKKYTQVRETHGGGTRKIYVPLNADKDMIMKRAIDLFFPDGVCRNLKIEDHEVDLFNSQHESVDQTATVESIFKATALQKLRFYLATKPKHIASDCESQRHVEVDLDKDDKSIMCETNSHRSPDENVALTQASTISDGIIDPSEGPFDEVYSLETFEEPQTRNECSTASTEVTNEFTYLVNSILDDFSTNQNCENLEHLDNLSMTNISQNNDETENQSSEKFETFQDVLSKLKNSIDNEKTNTVNVFREEIFTCCVRAMRRQTFSPFKKLFVRFSDMEGTSEGAIDEGGPTRELFRLLMNFIKDSQMFVGNPRKHISLNASALCNKYYYEAGRILSLSLVHGGPAPHFFSDLLFNLIINEQNISPTFEDVDEEIRLTLSQLENIETLPDAQNLMTDTNVFSIAGYNYILNLEEKTNIIQGTLKFYAINRIREPLSQFIDGLKTCGIYDLMVKYPNLFKSHMCLDEKILTAEDLEKLFHVVYSSIGSNARKVENKIISYYRDYILDCEVRSGQECQDDGDHGKTATIKDILIFATGAERMPPLGFPVTPTITFLHEDNSVYPKANTCSLELKLPVVHKTFEDFTRAMDFGIANCNSFGFA